MTAFSTDKAIRILCLEDSEQDRMVLEETLESDGLICNLVHARDREEFEAALGQGLFDLIISDFTLPGYDGMAALAAARKAQEQTPFIFVSGTIGEDRAIEGLKRGATDYVLKHRRDRLAPAVRRALREARERSERRQLEVQLRQAQKMEAFGQLAFGVAHDFNNLLAVIRGNAQLALKRSQKGGEEVQENLAQITTASEKAANLTRQLLAFSRKQEWRPRPVNLNVAINNMTKMLRRIIGEDIQLRHSHDGQTPCVHADEGMIEQVLLNLVVNARDAMPQGGDLLISTKKLRIDAKYARSSSQEGSGEFICLRVRDTGRGIAPENMERIFEPFFTTKEAGKGTGLGLATVYGIVKQHRGWIRVSSRVGAGTVFRIFLPAVEPPNPCAALPETEPDVRNGSERLLLVEDDPSVRLVTRRLLGMHGYQVIEAATGREALEIWRSQQATIDLLVTDMVMPGGITGRDLAEQLRQHRPELKVVFVSGYCANVVGVDSDYFQGRNNFFLQKPYHPRALMDILRDCLDEPAGVSRESAV